MGKPTSGRIDPSLWRTEKPGDADKDYTIELPYPLGQFNPADRSNGEQGRGHRWR